MTEAPRPSTKQQPVPHFTGTLALIWFLSGLTLLFGAGLMGYLFIRIKAVESIPIGTMRLPHLLWLSTALVLLASFSIQLAVTAIRRERQDLMRAWLVVTLIVGILFCIVQTPALASLIHQHHEARLAFEEQRAALIAGGGNPFLLRGQPFFGLVFVFILVHAAHVIGGIVQLVMVTRGAFLGRYDHEYHSPVKHAAMYWHFLDIVWIVMYAAMAATG